MLKRILQSTLLLFIMMIMAGAVSAAGYSGYTGYGFSSNDVTIKAGNTFDLYLEAGNMRNFSSTKFSIQFDDTVLTLKKVVLNPDGKVPGCLMKSDSLENPLMINWIYTDIFAGYENFAKLTFEVEDNAYSGDYWVEFTTYTADSLGYTNSGELVKNDNYTSALSKVTVKGKSYTSVSDIELNKHSLNISADSSSANTYSLKSTTAVSETLTATIYPSDASVSKVTWSSSDPDVAKVNASGKVTGVSDGVAIISATAGGVTAECQVTVDTPHSCNFTQRSTADKYLKNEATCESAAVYYYYCVCGNIGTKTFSSGGLLNHIFNNDGVCKECGYEVHICSFSAAWEYDEERHWHECECGKVKSRAAHYDENNDGKCDVCRYTVPAEELPLYGDVNGDGSVNAADSTLLKQYFAGYSVMINKKLADVNGDGSVTRKDAMILARHVTGWDGYITLPYKD